MARCAGGATQLVYPTPKARRGRDSYPHLVMEVKRNWRAVYGAETMATLRDGLAQVDAKLGGALPDFADTLLWFRRLHERSRLRCERFGADRPASARRRNSRNAASTASTTT